MTEYHVRQFDGGSSACDGRNCACASGAMAVAFGSSGKQTPTSDEFRTRSGRSCVPGVHSPSGGLFTSDVATTAATYGVDIEYGSTRRSHASLVSWCKANGAVVLGDYDQLPLALRVQDRFEGDHSVWVHDFRDDTFCWHDPLDTKPQRVRSSIVSRYNQKAGSPTKGLQGWTIVPLEVPDTGTGDDTVRDFTLLYGPDGRLVTGTLAVRADPDIKYLDLSAGTLHGPINPAAFGTKQAVRVRLKQPMVPGKPATDDWTLGYLIGDDAAFLLERNVIFAPYPPTVGLPETLDVRVVGGSSVYSGTVTG